VVQVVKRKMAQEEEVLLVSLVSLLLLLLLKKNRHVHIIKNRAMRTCHRTPRGGHPWNNGRGRVRVGMHFEYASCMPNAELRAN
jgi:hypothetical protein